MVYEDLEVVVPILTHAKIISYVQMPFYHYIKHPGSTTTTYENPRLYDILVAYQNAIVNSNELYYHEVVFCVAKRILINLDTAGFKYYFADFIEFIQKHQGVFNQKDLILKNKEMGALFNYVNQVVIPDYVYIYASNRCVENWCHFGPLAKVKDLNQSNLEQKSEGHVDYVKLKTLYERGGILVNDELIIKSPFGLLRSRSNFIVLDKDKQIYSGLLGFQKNHPFILDAMKIYQKSENMSKLNLKQVMIEVANYHKDIWFNDIDIISTEQLESILLIEKQHN